MSEQIPLPDELDRPITDTFGEPIRDAPDRLLTRRVALIRLLEASREVGLTESTALRLQLLAAIDGEQISRAQAKYLVRACDENPRGYLPFIMAQVQDYLEPLREALRAGAQTAA